MPAVTRSDKVGEESTQAQPHTQTQQTQTQTDTRTDTRTDKDTDTKPRVLTAVCAVLSLQVLGQVEEGIQRVLQHKHPRRQRRINL